MACIGITDGTWVHGATTCDVFGRLSTMVGRGSWWVVSTQKSLFIA